MFIVERSGGSGIVDEVTKLKLTREWALLTFEHKEGYKRRAQIDKDRFQQEFQNGSYQMGQKRKYNKR